MLCPAFHDMWPANRLQLGATLWTVGGVLAAVLIEMWGLDKTGGIGRSKQIITSRSVSFLFPSSPIFFHSTPTVATRSLTRRILLDLLAPHPLVSAYRAYSRSRSLGAFGVLTSFCPHHCVSGQMRGPAALVGLPRLLLQCHLACKVSPPS
ncbi:hypothetical protein C8J57DRAFT_458277 [Mycena rebaudengoi]|nr:hypothetical protein C8J57DRAFT_458277 [Mycena rebaudengoi]